MKSTDNLDVFLHSDASKAHAARVAAEHVRKDFCFSTDPEERERRARYYEDEAKRLEGRP